jgi:hypothetical protein
MLVVLRVKELPPFQRGKFFAVNYSLILTTSSSTPFSQPGLTSCGRMQAYTVKFSRKHILFSNWY